MCGPKPTSPYDRMIQKVVAGPNGCHLFTGGKGSKGHGNTSSNDGRSLKTHRVAWEKANGPIPAGMCVCHTCDTPNCVNPNHLFLGTIADNNRDMRDKNRHARGEGCGQAKLTDDDVIRIRSLAGSMSQTGIAKIYGVDQSHISRIVRGHYWSHIQRGA